VSSIELLSRNGFTGVGFGPTDGFFDGSAVALGSDGLSTGSAVGPAVGVVLTVAVGTPTAGTPPPPAAGSLLPQATNNSPIMATPVATATRVFHPPTDMSPNFLS
jgi:hypothetical protein